MAKEQSAQRDTTRLESEFRSWQELIAALATVGPGWIFSRSAQLLLRAQKQARADT